MKNRLAVFLRTTEDSSSRRIMCFAPVFILVTHNQTNNKCLPNFVQTDNVSSTIKVANLFGRKQLWSKEHGLEIINLWLSFLKSEDTWTVRGTLLSSAMKTQDLQSNITIVNYAYKTSQCKYEIAPQASRRYTDRPHIRLAVVKNFKVIPAEIYEGRNLRNHRKLKF